MNTLNFASVTTLVVPAETTRTDANWYSAWGKRTLDVCLALVALIVCLPILLLAAIALCLDSPGPIIFSQKRVGIGGKHFDIFKLRTMVVGANQQGCVTRSNDPRVTRVGRILRRTKIDELPQLINILMGDMSVVGARPLSADECIQVEQDGFRPTTLGFCPISAPGLIGLEQANRTRSLSYSERFAFNAAYESNINWRADLQILLRCFSQCRYVYYAAAIAALLEVILFGSCTC